MADKSKILWRIKALLFTGAITAASLRGCTYGPPPVDHMMKQELVSQKVESPEIDSPTTSSNYNFKLKSSLEEKSEQQEDL